MADLRITPGAQALVQGLAPAGVSDRADAVKAAQRAFFDVALTQAQAASPVRSPLQAPSPPVAHTPVQVSFDPSSPPPARTLRPGSLLDIKV
jgi:hypothetical protein